MHPRVRFAPSPTGYLHIGGARTALFNWLYARRHQGTFVLRIEDTDAGRSSADMVTGILDGLRWLGIDWDEGPGAGGAYGPYFQSERRERYTRAVERLVAADAAYYCYCRPEELQAKREAAEAAGGAWKYDRACRRLPADEIRRRESAHQSRAVRFAVPEGRTTFVDIVRGTITVAHDQIDDFVLERSDGHPTFQLSNVVDDVEMAITHVVRGDDHISNTSKQVLVYRALGASTPTFAHVPLILGPDKKRLSKRHGATAIGEYETQGFLPEAMVNFLALLGWSPGSGDEEVFVRDELIARFSLEGISGGNAVFNPDKLDWFNQQHIARLATAVLVESVRPYLEGAGLWRDSFSDEEGVWIGRVLDLVKSRVRRLPDFVAQARPFIVDSIDRDPAAVAKHLSDSALRPVLLEWASRLEHIESFEPAALEAELRRLADERGLKAGALIHATRVAVTGQAVSPGIFDVLQLVGRGRVVERIRRCL